MPALTIPNTFTNATTAVASEVNANFTAVSTLLNSTKLDADNLQDGAVTAAKIGTNAVTGAKLNSDTVDNSTLQYTNSTLSIKDSGVTTAKINDSAVTTAKINDGAVTQAKRASLGQQLSSSVSTTSTSTSFTAITGLSASITTTGRPVFIGLVSDGAGSPSLIGFGTGGAYRTTIRLKQDSTEIAQWPFDAGTAGGDIPCSSVWHIYSVAAGTYTYSMEWKITSGGTATAQNVKLIAYEL